MLLLLLLLLLPFLSATTTKAQPDNRTRISVRISRRGDAASGSGCMRHTPRPAPPRRIVGVQARGHSSLGGSEAALPGARRLRLPRDPPSRIHCDAPEGTRFDHLQGSGILGLRSIGVTWVSRQHRTLLPGGVGRSPDWRPQQVTRRRVGGGGVAPAAAAACQQPPSRRRASERPSHPTGGQAGRTRYAATRLGCRWDPEAEPPQAWGALGSLA